MIADVTRVSPVSRSQATIFLSQDTVTILTHTEQTFHSQVRSGYYIEVSALLFFVNFMFFHVYVISVRDFMKPSGPWTMNKSSINSQRKKVNFTSLLDFTVLVAAKLHQLVELTVPQ